ncbi:MAG: hypothetical protein WDW38_008458 [Sanguina aurantia]
MCYFVTESDEAPASQEGSLTTASHPEVNQASHVHALPLGPARPSTALDQAETEHLHSLHDHAARSAAIAAAVLGTLVCDHHVATAVAVAETMDPAGGADYCAEQHATEPGTATAADAPTQSAEQAEVERLYSLHDAAARSAATAAALMNMPGCDHHVAAAVAVAQLCEDPAAGSLALANKDTFMTHTTRTPLSRYLATALLATAMIASALPVQAQRHGRGGYHGRPQPQYNNRYNNRYDNRGRRGGGGSGGLIAGALLGVIAGAAISNSAQRPPPDVVYSSPPPPPPPGVVYYDNNYPPPGNGY